MKKYLIGFLTIVMCFVLVGCGKKNETGIKGVWRLEKVQNGPITITFKDKNVMNFTSGTYQSDGTYKVEGNKVTFYDVWEYDEVFEYEIKDGRLSLNAVDEETMSYIDMEKQK